jgi:type IX secretion system PorP/SprF family membrane protein
MKRLLTIFALSLLPLITYSQYVPNSAQNFHYASLYNPAFTGIENFLDLKVGYRYQWGGFKDNSPQMGNLSVTFRIKQPLDLKQNGLRPSRPDVAKTVPWFRRTAHGLGFNGFSEMYGPMLRTGGGIHYGLHMPMSEKISLSLGVGGMIENNRIDENKLYWGSNPQTPDPVYEKVMAGGANATEVWTRAGFLVYSDKFYVGGTYYPYNTTLKTSDIAFNTPYYQAGFQAGVALPLNEDFEVRPTVWALMQSSGAWSIDYNAKFYMEDKVWFGLTYRDVSSGAVSGGFNVSEAFSASYSFEFPLGKLRTFSGSTHELVMAFRLKNFRHVNQRVW